MNIHSVLFTSFFERLLFSKRRSPGFSLCTWPYACVSVTLNRCIVYQSVADLGQEPGGPGSPYFEPTLRPKGRKKISETPLPPYLKVWIRHQGAWVPRWWKHSPPTNVAGVQIPALTPYVGWVCCWFSPLLREVFRRVLRFSPQKPTLPNSNSIWNARTRLNEFIWTLKCFVGKKAIYIFFFYLFFTLLMV